MPTVTPNAMALPKSTKLPGIGSLLISTGGIGDECSLCGNSFETYEASNLALKLPCVDNQCGPCARMWHILNSPTCLVCYGNFKCPRFTRKEALKALPRLIIDPRPILQQPPPLDSHIDSFPSFRDGYSARNTLQPPSPLDSHIDSFLNFRDRHIAFHTANTGSEDNTNSSSGSLMREDEDAQAVPELSEDLLEALALANNRVGTDFSFQDIEAGIPRAMLSSCTNLQLADRLTQACIMRLSESGCDNISRRRSSQEATKKDVDLGRCAIGKAKSYRCPHCRSSFRSPGHLRQHLVVHTPAHRTCSVCGKVLGTPNSRRIHEKQHRETELEREARLGKAKAKRQELRENSRGRVQKL